MTQAAEMQELPQDLSEGIPLGGDDPLPTKFIAKHSLPVVPGLRPKQVKAAMMLVQGRMAKEVAVFVGVSPETVSRWRVQPAFQLLIRELLQESIDATKLGLVSLFAESIVQLRGLIQGFDEQNALKAINLLFNKAGPVLAAINAEVQRPLAGNSGH
jgi:hypothetical protein